MDELKRNSRDEAGEGVPPELARALERLDARAARRAAHIDEERAAAAVLDRLRTEPESRAFGPFERPARLVRVAAAIAILVTAGVVGTRLASHPQAAAKPWLPVVDSRTARSLVAAGADSVLDAVDRIQVLNGATPVSSASVEDLNAQELRALLQAMQSEGGS